MNTTQITLVFEGSPAPADIAARLRFQAGLLEGMDPKAAASKKNTSTKAATAPVAEAIEADEDEDFEVKKPAKKKATPAAFEDDEETTTEATEEAASDDDEMDFNTPAKKAATKVKAKKITDEDVNDACKARAAVLGGKAGREEVLGILRKKFKTETVSTLKPEQYEAVIAAMQV